MTVAILKGVDEVLDDWLGLTGRTEYGDRPRRQEYHPKYHSKRAAIDLSRNSGPLDSGVRTLFSPSQMISEAMNHIVTNSRKPEMGRPASSNWKWEKSCHLASHNDSAEKQLEKYVAFLLDDRWVNQVPVCNGLGQGASACRIDLAYRPHPSEYELIELKFGQEEDRPGSDHPLYAAMELLSYGLLYLLFRKNGWLSDLRSRKHHLLHAESICLVVLAPVTWYHFKTRAKSAEEFRFDWLEQSITDGLQAYLKDQSVGPLRMALRFEALSEEFASAYRPLSEAIRGFRTMDLGLRRPVYR